MPAGPDSLADLQQRLGHVFAEPALLLGALTHASAAHLPAPRTSERLEFLGDAVVGLALSEMLVRHYPDREEGALSKFRAALVNTDSCKSRITYIDGDAGILRYRGYPIEELAEKSTYLETAYPIVKGELPTPRISRCGSTTSVSTRWCTKTPKSSWMAIGTTRRHSFPVCE